MFRIELEQLNDIILEYESQLEMLHQVQADMISISWQLVVSWEGASKEQFSINSDEVGKRLVYFLIKMRQMKDILKKTAQPEVNRELNRCEGFADTLCMYGPPEPGEIHELAGTLYLDDSYIAGIAQKSNGVGYEDTPREVSLWNNAMDSIRGGWFRRGGLKFVSLDMSGRDQEFRRYSKEQEDFILQFNESFFRYQQNIDSLEDRLSAEFGTIMEIQTADITGRIYEPLVAADRSVNMDRLGYLMTLEPGALSDADYQDLISAYEVLSMDNQAKEIEDFINRIYIPHFKKMGGGKYQVSYTVSPVARELSERYRKYVNGRIEVNLSAQAVRELRAQLLEAGCSELGEITGGIVEDNRPKGIFGEAKRDIQEMWKNLDDKIIEILDGEVGNRLAEIHEKVLMAPVWNSLEAMKQISGKKGAAAIEQLQENWHDFNHGMIVGEYLWVSGMITGAAGLPDTVETLGIALNERGGVAVAGDLVLGIINSVKETWTEFQDGDVKDKGRVIGRLIPDAILAGMAAVKGIKSFKAARLTKTEATVTVKNGVETVEDLGEVGAVAKVGSTVEGVVADKVDDVVRKGTCLSFRDLMTPEEATRYDKYWSDSITSIPKGSRPDPSTYLSQEYISSHLSQFDDGISVVQSEWAYGRYSEINGFVGVPDDNTLFVLPKDYCDQVISRANGNISVIEKELGFPEGYFSQGGGLVRIDVEDTSGLNIRIPSGNEATANELWIPGGYTSGGVPEAITDTISLDRTSVTRIEID